MLKDFLLSPAGSGGGGGMRGLCSTLVGMGLS